VLTPCYAEHPHAWQRAGHSWSSWLTTGRCALDSLDVLVLVNPNNPTGRLMPRERLLAWHARLAARGGWLVVDEAFMDNTPQTAWRPCRSAGLIVLRSFGKFFGLAGVRLGFVLAEPALLQALAELLGPWTVSGPTGCWARCAWPMNWPT
jgi:cobalamin biosynthetic protein CobC